MPLWAVTQGRRRVPHPNHPRKTRSVPRKVDARRRVTPQGPYSCRTTLKMRRREAPFGLDRRGLRTPQCRLSRISGNSHKRWSDRYASITYYPAYVMAEIVQDGDDAWGSETRICTIPEAVPWWWTCSRHNPLNQNNQIDPSDDRTTSALGTECWHLEVGLWIRVMVGIDRSDSWRTYDGYNGEEADARVAVSHHTIAASGHVI